ncbi:choline/carnitine O-acyltransferase [Skeletonema marinoi]|uniref:Choline/carnitine O-acyltransferase n=1 Tax=Skeletonema marinoi TaxID=267567 RepID=A0AAD9DC16_9STRA|nr:choline/carnitine O-acyltransferase [Skeletonema marinoi]
MMALLSNKRFTLLIVLLLAACHCSDGFLQPYGRNISSQRRQPIYYQQLDVSTVTHTEDDHTQSIKGTTPSLNHPFRPWPNQVVECEGDYTKETYLEQIIGGQLYENNNQKTLPKLPVPTLKQTIERFIPTALPLCESDEELQSLIRACDKFEDQAKELQLRLLQRKEDWKESSWLQKWRNQKGYLEVRDPVAVHRSSGNDCSSQGKKTSMLWTAAMRQSWQQASLFDGVQIFIQCLSCTKKGIRRALCIVACKGYFFAVDFVDDQANPLALETLAKTLVKCQEMAQEQESLDIPKAIGWLSGCNRDGWASSLDKLTRYESFKEAMKVLESGAFVLCLDETLPETISDASEIFWNGRGVLGCNRFFDKSVNIIVNGLGQAAVLGEHSMMDGSIPMLVCNQINKYKYERFSRASLRLAPPDKSNEDIKVHDIFGDCWEDNDLTNLANQLGQYAHEQYQELTDSVELKTIVHEDYGKQFIKKGRVSPDAFMQLVLQLAAYRCFGKQVATYEATQTRQFVHGRTETARTVSMDSKAFVEAMGYKSMVDNDGADEKKDKLKLLRNAAESHHEYTRSACNGYGVDRHLLGLSLVISEEEEQPELFKDPVFIRSKSWRFQHQACRHVQDLVPWWKTELE